MLPELGNAWFLRLIDCVFIGKGEDLTLQATFTGEVEKNSKLCTKIFLSKFVGFFFFF